MSDNLLPCPFCGAGKTLFHENSKMWTGQKWSKPISVSVQHLCEAVPGQPNRMIERVGRDLPSAIAAWNRRADRASRAVQGDDALLRQCLDALTCGAGHPECESLDECTIAALRARLGAA